MAPFQPTVTLPGSVEQRCTCHVLCKQVVTTPESGQRGVTQNDYLQRRETWLPAGLRERIGPSSRSTECKGTDEMETRTAGGMTWPASHCPLLGRVIPSATDVSSGAKERTARAAQDDGCDQDSPGDGANDDVGEASMVKRGHFPMQASSRMLPLASRHPPHDGSRSVALHFRGRC